MCIKKYNYNQLLTAQKKNSQITRAHKAKRCIMHIQAPKQKKSIKYYIKSDQASWQTSVEVLPDVGSPNDGLSHHSKKLQPPSSWIKLARKPQNTKWNQIKRKILKNLNLKKRKKKKRKITDLIGKFVYKRKQVITQREIDSPFRI